MSKSGQRRAARAGMLGALALSALVFSIQPDSVARTSADTAAVVLIPAATSTPAPSPLPTSGPPPAEPLASKASTERR